MTPSSRSRRRSSQTAPGTAPENTPGGDLERRVARLEFAEGALARVRVPVVAEAADDGRSVLTDMDILSVEVDARLRLSRSSLECKSGKGQTGEPMNLVWLAGFRQLMQLDRVVYVRPSVSPRGRALARRLDISVLDESTLVAREAGIAWLPERFAHVDGPECIAAERRTDTQLKGLPYLPQHLTQFVRHGALLADSHEILAGLQALGEAFDRQGSVPNPAAIVLAGHSLVALVAAGLTDAGRLDHVSPAALKARLQRALTTGDPDDDGSVLALLERADAVLRHVADRTHRAYVDAGAEPLQISVPSLRDTVAQPPSYLDSYIDFVQRLRVNPLVARDLLQTAELTVFDALAGGVAWKADAFSRLFTAEHQGMLLVAARCLGDVAGHDVAGVLGDLPRLFRELMTSPVPDRRSAPVEQPGLRANSQAFEGDGEDTSEVFSPRSSAQ